MHLINFFADIHKFHNHLRTRSLFFDIVNIIIVYNITCYSTFLCHKWTLHWYLWFALSTLSHVISYLFCDLRTSTTCHSQFIGISITLNSDILINKLSKPASSIVSLNTWTTWSSSTLVFSTQDITVTAVCL